MVIKVYMSGISGNKEVKKRQQRVLMILDSKNIKYETIDITEPGLEHEKEFMQQNSNPKDLKHPLPPQLFNDKEYCGDYEDFDLANENDELEKFLKMSDLISKAEITLESNKSSEKQEAPSSEENISNGVTEELNETKEEQVENESEAKEEQTTEGNEEEQQ